MNEKHPPSRPALRKSVDAALHPALAGRTLPTPPKATTRTTAKPLLKAPAEPDDGPREPNRAKGKATGKGGRGATSDVLRPTKKDPAVTLKLQVPKSLRKRLKAQAKAEGIEPEVLAARFVADALR